MIVLSTITFGVYAWFWWYFINRELRDLGRAHSRAELGDNPALSALAVSLGVLIIVPPFVSLYNTCKRVQAAQQLASGRVELNGWIGAGLTAIWIIGLSAFIPLIFGFVQSELNKVWRNQQVTDPIAPGLPHPGAEAALPASAVPALVPANWYPDPWRLARLRYWDGASWTGHTAD